MRPSNSLQRLHSFLSAHGLAASGVLAPQLVEMAILFFREVYSAGLDSNPSSDMLLYQWGVFNFGQGEHFQFGITRQFIEVGSGGDHGMSQLSFVAYYAPTPELRKIRVSNRWCESRQEVKNFHAYILASEAYAAVKTQQPVFVKVAWNKV